MSQIAGHNTAVGSPLQVVSGVTGLSRDTISLAKSYLQFLSHPLWQRVHSRVPGYPRDYHLPPEPLINTEDSKKKKNSPGAVSLVL